MNGEKALKVFKKYGFNSTNSSPYLCSIGNRIGVSFKCNDNRFGLIERSTFFDNIYELDTFLKLYRNYLDNGKSEHTYMLLDNYQVMFPNLIYAKDDKVVLNDEMVYKTKNKDDLSELEKLKLVASNLLSYYVDVSSRQVKHINNVSFMKNILLKKEKELKNEIRKLSKKKEEEKITTIKTEYFQYDNSLYSSYKNYLDSIREKDHAINLINRLWELNKKLEISKEYYRSIVISRELADKIRLLDLKIDYVKSLKGKKSFLLNINKNLKLIEKEYVKDEIEDSYVDDKINKVRKKYSFFSNISIFYLDDYLKESLLNDDYDYLANKYSLDYSNKLNKGDIVGDLRNAYQLLNFDERRVLTLFNSKYKTIFELILEIPDFFEWTNKKLTKYLENQDSVSKFKEECIDELCSRLGQDINKNIREKYFVNINYKSFKLFVTDIVKLLMVLKNIDNKMVLSNDCQLYTTIPSISSLKNKYVYYLTDKNDVLSIKDKKGVLGVFKVTKGTPVLYSPYSLDFGDLYDRNSRIIKEIRNNKISLIIDVNDVIITRDKKPSEVYYYKNVVDVVNGISFVNDIKYSNKIVYYNFIIRKR